MKLFRKKVETREIAIQTDIEEHSVNYREDYGSENGSENGTKDSYDIVINFLNSKNLFIHKKKMLMQCEIAMNDAISCSSMSYAKFSDIFSKFGYTNAMFIYGAHCKEIYNIVWKDTIYDDLTDCIHHFGLFEYSIDLLYILLHGVAIFCLEEEVEADAYNRVLKDLKEEHREALIHYVYKKNIKLN